MKQTAINYCKEYKLKLEDFNEQGFFVASKKVNRYVRKESFASKRVAIKSLYFEGFYINGNDCITIKTYGYFNNCKGMLLTYNSLNELKELSKKIIL